MSMNTEFDTRHYILSIYGQQLPSHDLSNEDSFVSLLVQNNLYTLKMRTQICYI